MCASKSEAVGPLLGPATAVVIFWAAHAPAGDLPPPNYRIAFIGDQNDGPAAYQVLDLISKESTDAVVHIGDFDYGDDPPGWDAMISGALGPDFPYFACVGNHDEDRWRGSSGYQSFLEARMQRVGVAWEGDYGVKSAHRHQGILFVFAAPSIYGDGDDDFAPYLAEQLAADRSAWRIGAWHVNQEAMQIGDKHDQAGWELYEVSRKGGAIVATAHTHEYGRTHPLSSCRDRIVASTECSFSIGSDRSATASDEGVTFVFHSGLGGSSIREQTRCFPSTPPYGCNGEWASIYAQQQSARFGALFGVFNFEGDPCRAWFYFKDVAGTVVDDFYVTSTLGPCRPCPADLDASGAVGAHDFIALMTAWGGCAAGSTCDSDLNLDGVTGVADLMAMLGAWGKCGN